LRTKVTVTPPGGVIARKDGSNEPYGLIMERAFMQALEQSEPMTPNGEIAATRAGQMLYAEAHIAKRGEEQAMYISPVRDAIDGGLHPTNHTDFVVAPLDQMFMLWSAINRISRAGAEIGPRNLKLEKMLAVTSPPEIASEGLRIAQ